MQIPGRRIEAAEIVTTNPFPRGGDGMFLRAQLIIEGGTPSGDVTVTLETKNTEDTTWVSVSGALAITNGSTGGTLFEKHYPPTPTTAGLKEQLRLKVVGGTAGWKLIRIFPPVFYDAAIA